MPLPAKAAPGLRPDADARWHIQSQQPWQLEEEHCTLTILENSSESLVQFELLKHSTHTTMYVTCSNTQFDGLCAEQKGLSGTAQINAAISQLFHEAHEEIEGDNFDECTSMPAAKTAALATMDGKACWL